MERWLMIDQAMILAAGRGTRMGAVARERPKPLLEVAGAPLLHHVLSGLADVGLRRAVVVVGHLGEQIERRFGAVAGAGLRISYCRQERPTGTATAALLAQRHLAPAPLVMSFADILCARSNYRKLLACFEAHPCEVLLGLNPVEDPWEGAAIYRDGDRVTRLVEKPPRGASATRWNSAGVMVLTSPVWPVLEELPPSARGEYELPQGIARMVETGHDVRGVEFAGFCSDMGRPDDLARVVRLAQAGALDLS
ncbi:MAG TPA: nucleotidyltransferase family protein [Armatimonadota bacterium]|nr:nucleotidyltransferase family protein [Armatimonadota bacterium]